MQNLHAFKELLSSPKNIFITTHQKPDADALGSSLGLSAFLKKKGHRVTVVTPTDYPDFLAWMAGNDDVIVFNANNQKQSEDILKMVDIIFCLDFSSLHRINELGEMVAKASATKVLIDHHLDPEPFADYQHWSTEAASTAELVYELIEMMGETALIDKDIAECLYAGIMTDTGCFRHPNVTQTVHEVTAKLIALGADTAKVSQLVYDTNSLDRMRFFGYMLSEKLVVLEEYKTAYFAVSAEELKRFNSKTGDTEGLVNYALSLKGIVFAAVIIDRIGIVKMSFRSRGGFSVNNFAKQHFGGGGHKNAAGGASFESLDKTVNKFLGLLPEYKKELNTKTEKIKANV